MKLKLWDRRYIERYKGWFNLYLVPSDFEYEAISFDEAYTTYIGFEFHNQEKQYRFFSIESNYKLIASNEKFINEIELEQDLSKRIGIAQYIWCWNWRLGAQIESYNFKQPYYRIHESNDYTAQLPLFTHYYNNRLFIYKHSLFKFRPYSIELKDEGLITEKEINETRIRYLKWSLNKEVARLRKYREYSDIFLQITNDRLSSASPGYDYY